MKNVFAKLGVALAAILVVGITSVPALADSGSGVARVSVVNGTITVQHGDNGDTEAAVVNAPISVGDYLSTGSGSHAEVQLDNADFVRVASDAQVRFSKLDANDHQLQLAAGTVDLRVLHSSDANIALDTPSITIRPDEAGSYRVTVDSSGSTIFTVRSGQADLIGPQGSQTIDSGTTVLVKGASSNPQVSTIDTVAYDDFDSWNAQRDQYEQATSADQYANQNIVGLDDLDSYGHWVWVSDYGNVWVPNNDQSDWAPYQDGRWSWAPYYGWTWVGYEPWGWAPYHYGRWFYANGYGWAWWPGPVYGPVAYCPGAVAFFGYGSGFGFSIGFGFSNVAWVPLAPYEPFYPWWGSGFGANITNINITNINITNVNVTKVYRNARGPHAAIAALTVRDFENGSAAHHYLPVRTHDLQNVGLLKSTLPIQPGKGNMRFSDRPNPIVRPQPLSPRFHVMALQPRTQTGSLGRQGGTIGKPIIARSGSPIIARSGNPIIARPSSPIAKLNSAAPSSTWGRFASAHGTAVDAGIGPRASAMTNPATTNTMKHTQPNNIATRSGPSAEWARFNANHGAGSGGPGTMPAVLPNTTRYNGSATNAAGSTPRTFHATGNSQAGGSFHSAPSSLTPSSPWTRFNGSTTHGAGSAPRTFHATGNSQAGGSFRSAPPSLTPSSPWTRFNGSATRGAGSAPRALPSTGSMPRAIGSYRSVPSSSVPSSPWSRFSGTYNDHPTPAVGTGYRGYPTYSNNYPQRSGNSGLSRPQFQRQSGGNPNRPQRPHNGN